MEGFVALLNRLNGECVDVALSGPGKQVATELTVAGGEIYVAGSYDGSPDLMGCGERLPDAQDLGGAFVAKLSMESDALQVLWARGFTTSGRVEPGALALFSNGVRFAGSFTGEANFGGGDLGNPTSFARIFVAEFDAATGQHRLSAHAESMPPSDDHDVVTAMLPTAQGMVLTGSYQGDVLLTGGLATVRTAYVVDTDLQP